jgi:hypothetical protein
MTWSPGGRRWKGCSERDTKIVLGLIAEIMLAEDTEIAVIASPGVLADESQLGMWKQRISSAARSPA